MPDEIERFSELTQIIFKEIDEGVYQTVKKTSPSQLLLSLFAANMKNTNIIHFDSICQFQLTMFKDQLVHHIGLAIDEFKQEEDHQTFIDMLRKYIDKRESTHLEVHIIQGDSFIFYHPTGEQFSTLALRNIVHNEPLYIVGLDVEGLNLAPLIAMSPQKIYLYGDNPSEPKTMTVINVFQEKVVFQPDRNSTRLNSSHVAISHAVVHRLCDSPPTRRSFDLCSTRALRNIVHNEPLYIVGLDVEELNLAPLIAMSPQKIYLYGDNPSEPKTMTVINVFQEKVVFQPISNFPFPRYLDMK